MSEHGVKSTTIEGLGTSASTLVIHCTCGGVGRSPTRGMRAGDKVALSCGVDVTISGDPENIDGTIDKIHEAVDDLRDTFRKLSKRR